MLIRTGLGGQLSGSVGGVTASHNRYGQYLRNRTVPVNPNSARQQLVRACMSECSAAWKTLTNAQRAAWEAYAAETPVLNKLGETVKLTGQAMFVRTNVWLQQAGESTISEAPSSPGLCSMGPSETTVADASSQTIAGTYNGTFTRAVVQLGPAISAGVSFFKSPYSFVGYSASSGGDIEVIVPATFRYGLLQVGQRRPIRVSGMDAAGRLSNVIEEIVTVQP